jgi:hypothetical protein
MAAHPARHRPRLRLAATGALVAVGGAVSGTALALTTAAPAGAEPAPSHAGWDGHRYWFLRNGEWRWTSHYDVYLRYTSGVGSGVGSGSGGGSSTGAKTGPGSGGLHQGWDGHRYWFQRNGEWRWTTHYDIYLRYTSRGSSPTPPKSPPPPIGGASSLDAAIAFAEGQLGKPYVWGGNGPNGYDCSGLVQQAFLRAGLQLPRVAVDQFRATRPIAAADLRRGDLLFWSYSGRVTGIHHVAVYLGGGRYIEAPRPGKDVRISVLSTGYYPTFFGRVPR